jgi:hypothetical protein
MTDVEDDSISGTVKRPMNTNGELYDTEVGSEVSARL